MHRHQPSGHGAIKRRWDASISFVPGSGAIAIKPSSSERQTVQAAYRQHLHWPSPGCSLRRRQSRPAGLRGLYTDGECSGDGFEGSGAGANGTVSFLNTSNANYSLATAALGAATLAQSFAPEVSYPIGAGLNRRRWATSTVTVFPIWRWQRRATRCRCCSGMPMAHFSRK